MAFNFGNNQMFQGRAGRSQGRQMQGRAQQGFGPRPFQPNPGYRGQPRGQSLMQQQPQGFQAGFDGYQVGQRMVPYPGTGNAAGQTMPNMQIQQQFMMQQQYQQQQQQKKAMEQQRKQAEENQKKQEELRRRHNFEMQQRKLQSQKKGAASHLEVDNLFGKKEKRAGTAAMNLIGSLGMQPSSTGAAKHAPASSIFSRPGSSYQSYGHNCQTALHGIEFMSHGGMGGQAPPTDAASGTDYFGDFAQGPSIPGQDTGDEFSGFQEARSFGQGTLGPSSGMTPSGMGAVQGSFSQSSSWAIPSQTADVATSSLPNTSFTGPITSQLSGALPTQNSPTSSSGSLNVGSTFPLKPRADSSSGFMSPGPSMQGLFEMANSFGALKSRSSSVSSQDSIGRVSSVSSSFSNPVSGNMVGSTGGFMPGVADAGNVVPPLSNDEKVDSEPEAEQTAAEKLAALYGTELPEWCINGTDLPSVYNDVTRRTTGCLNAIDTGELYHVLLTSDVSRDKLGLMWNEVNRANPGQLNALELRMILGLVALAQAGIKAERLTLGKLASCKAAPIPSFPEDVLEAKGRVWSFMEHQATGENIPGPSDSNVDDSNAVENKEKYNTSGEASHAGPTGFLVSSSFSLAPTDPNDKYSVFRTAGSEMTEFQGAGVGMGSSTNQTESAEVRLDVGGISQQLQQQQQQKLLQKLREQPSESPKEQPREDEDFGDFESVSFHPPVSQSSSKSVTGGSDDFGTFQQNLVPSLPKGNLSQDLFGDNSAYLAKSLQGNTLKNTSSSTDKSNTATMASLFTLGPPAPVSSPVKPSEGGLTAVTEAAEKETNVSVPDEPFGTFLSSGTSATNVESGITKPSLATTEAEAQNADDKYSVFRNLVISSETSAEEPAADDAFGDFAGPAFVSEVPPPMDDDFGDFQFTETTPVEKSLVPNSWKSNVVVSNAENSSSQPSSLMTSGGQITSTIGAEKANDSKVSIPAEMGHFQSLGEAKLGSSSAFEKDLTFLMSEGSQDLPKGGSNGVFASFGSFNAVSATPEGAGDCPRSVSGSSQALINTVPLELSQRYSLSKQFEDFDQHSSAWCRCLNSCLLTLATASLAIQKIKETSLQQEILRSKEGSLYFSSIVEVYRVTRRIRTSVEKTAANNTKLKDILDEVERTWKSITSFLTGSDILPSQSSLDLSRLHVISQDDRSVACGVCLLNVEKTIPGATKQADGKLKYGGRQYHTTCANFWCNRVDSVLPTLLPVYSLI